MNSEDIDELFYAMKVYNYSKLFEYANIELTNNEFADKIFYKRKEEIYINIMKQIEKGDYDYFLSKKESVSLDDIDTFVELMCHSEKSDDIIKIIENGVGNLLGSDRVRLIKSTHDSDYIKSFIEDKEKRERLGITSYGYGIIELMEATNDLDYIKSFLENKEKRDKIGAKLHNSYIIELIEIINDPEYFKSILEDREKRDRLELSLNEMEIINFIRATGDSDYIKCILEDKEKRNKIGIVLDGFSAEELIGATNDVEYIKSIIENDEKREEIGVYFNFFEIARLIERTNDAEYIKSYIESDEKRKKFEMSEDECMDFNIELMLALKDVEYIKKFIQNPEYIKKIGLEFDDIIYCITRFNSKEIRELMSEIEKSNFIEYKRKIKLPENMTIGIEIESEGIHSDLILKLTNIIDEGWKCERRCKFNRWRRGYITKTYWR